MRVICTGTYLHLDEDGFLCSVATDGRRIVRYSSSVKPDDFSPVIVPHRAMDEICKIGSGTFSVSSNLCKMSVNGWNYCSNLIDATFPDYTRMIAPLTGSNFEVDRVELIEAVTRLSSVSDSVGLVDLSFGERLIAQRHSVGEGIETLECLPSEDGEKSFSVPYGQLIKSLESLHGNRVQFFIRTPMDPIRLFDPDDPKSIAVQAPSAPRVKAVAA